MTGKPRGTNTKSTHNGPFSHGKQTDLSLSDQQHCPAIMDLSPYCFGFFLLGTSLAIRYNPSMMMRSKALAELYLCKFIARKLCLK